MQGRGTFSLVDSLVKDLKAYSHIKSINMSDARVTPQVTVRLMDALTQSTNLQELNGNSYPSVTL
jgi:hypothetical protein